MEELVVEDTRAAEDFPTAFITSLHSVLPLCLLLLMSELCLSQKGYHSLLIYLFTAQNYSLACQIKLCQMCS